jgi:hypothetical protein
VSQRNYGFGKPPQLKSKLGKTNSEVTLVRATDDEEVDFDISISQTRSRVNGSSIHVPMQKMGTLDHSEREYNADKPKQAPNI